MDICKISRNERQECINYMLCNQSLEESLKAWKEHKRSDEYMIEMLQTLAGRAQDNGGMILAVQCDEIPVGADYVDFFMPNQKGSLHWVEDKNGLRFAMAFTSKKRFQECNDTSGVVMFMHDLFTVVEKRKELDGIIINLEREEVFLDKMMLRAAIWLMENKEEAYL